jgi:hypothetical protein
LAPLRRCARRVAPQRGQEWAGVVRKTAPENRVAAPSPRNRGATTIDDVNINCDHHSLASGQT